MIARLMTQPTVATANAALFKNPGGERAQTSVAIEASASSTMTPAAPISTRCRRDLHLPGIGDVGIEQRRQHHDRNPHDRDTATEAQRSVGVPELMQRFHDEQDDGKACGAFEREEIHHRGREGIPLARGEIEANQADQSDDDASRARGKGGDQRRGCSEEALRAHERNAEKQIRMHHRHQQAVLSLALTCPKVFPTAFAVTSRQLVHHEELGKALDFVGRDREPERRLRSGHQMRRRFTARPQRQELITAMIDLQVGVLHRIIDQPKPAAISTRASPAEREILAQSRQIVGVLLSSSLRCHSPIRCLSAEIGRRNR